MKSRPSATRPASRGSLTVRKSIRRGTGPRPEQDGQPEGGEDLGQHRPVEDPPDDAVVHGPAERAQRERAVSGSETRGSSPASAHAKKATYIATIRNSPWAKLTISMRPKISERPGRDERVDEPHQEPADERLRDQVERQLTPAGRRRPGAGPLLAVLPRG